MPSLSTPAPTDPNSSAGNYGSMSRMAGPDEGGGEQYVPSPESGGPNPEELLRATIGQLRGIEETFRSLSQAFPQATQSIRNAVTATQGVLKEIVANPGGMGGMDSPPPPTEL